MLTQVGRVVMNKNMARGLSPVSAVAIGNGGTDLTYGVPIASSLNDVELASKIFFSASIDTIQTLTPPATSFPRITVQHTFFARNVPPTGVAVAYIDEFGIYARDPDTGLYVLVDRQTFNREQFNVPATGASLSRDAIEIIHTLGVL